MGRELGAYVLGRLNGKYSKYIASQLILGGLPEDEIAEVSKDFDKSLVDSSELPLEVRAAYKTFFDVCRRFISDSPRTRIATKLRARALYEALDVPMRAIDKHFGRNKRYRAQMRDVAMAS